MITLEIRKKVADIVKATLVEHFADKFVSIPSRSSRPSTNSVTATVSRTFAS